MYYQNYACKPLTHINNKPPKSKIKKTNYAINNVDNGSCKIKLCHILLNYQYLIG